MPPFDRLYQTIPLLFAAYVVHFGAQAMRSPRSPSPRCRRRSESAHLLGAPPRRAGSARSTSRSCGPASWPGAALVLLSTVKELPATLLLAPIGMGR